MAKNDKRSIDRKRDGAVTIELCDPDDKTSIRKMVSISGSLYCITDKSVFLTCLADEIDPARTNINIPSIYRRELEYGFTNETVQRVFLLAEALFVKTHLGHNCDCDAAILHSMSATKLLLEMSEIHEKLNNVISNN